MLQSDYQHHQSIIEKGSIFLAAVVLAVQKEKENKVLLTTVWAILSLSINR